MSISDFADMMPHTVTHEEFASRDEYGLPAYGSPASLKARVSYRPHKVRTPAGDEVVARGEVWLNTAGTTVDTEDRITLPDGSTPPILSVDGLSDELGAHHAKVHFG